MVLLYHFWQYRAYFSVRYCLSLVVGDYYKGPKQDLDPLRPGDIWEFKKKIDGRQFYIKVKIVQVNGEDIVKCLGFHEDDFA